MADEPIARAAYDRLAEAFAAHAEDSAFNACYDRPAVQSLLPPVAGRRVLDAGCGPGLYAAWLADAGAEVVGIDVSPAMVRLARERLGRRARIEEADLGRPLAFLGDARFDLVVSALVLDYVRDWDAVFAEFFRVLRPGGVVVVSAEHPAAVFYEHHPGGTYHEVERVSVDFKWNGSAPVPTPHYRRPLAAMIQPILGAGFRLDTILEPRPTPAFRDRAPDDYEALMRRPGFICFRARKPEGTIGTAPAIR